MKLKGFLVLFSLFFLIPIEAFAVQSGSTSREYDYTIEGYDINITVNENNAFEIVETIDAFFNVKKHGILRKIPLKNQVVRQDGTKSTNRATVENITVNEKHTVSVDAGYKVIKIGDASHVITGAKEYQISYTYSIGKDTGKSYDEFYLNLIGDEWDTAISGITFTIQMPKSFDEAKLGFSSGVERSTESSKVRYEVDGNFISGYYSGSLDPGEALTVRLELPEGYFIGAESNSDPETIIPACLSVLFLLISFLLWKIFGQDEPTTDKMEYYPPQGINSAEVGFIYKGKADERDVISLLIYLANKGYLEISDNDNSSSRSRRKSFTITKLKEYDGDNPNERMFLEGVFTKTKYRWKRIEYIPLEEVTKEDLRDNFYKTVNIIKKNMNNAENRQKIFERSSLNKRPLILLMMIIALILITTKPILEYNGSDALLVVLLIPSILITMTIIVFSMSDKLFKIMWTTAIAVIIGGIWFGIVLPSLLLDTFYLVTYFIGAICIMLMARLLKVMPKRTAYGHEMLEKINGFKQHLEITEEPKLRSLVEDNPEYAYHILPYAYVLGVSDLWMKQFEVLSLHKPLWYNKRLTDKWWIHDLMNDTMNSISSATTSGGGSGGGSSGGGSGGGGGSSW